MDRLGDDFLADAAFAFDQHRHAGARGFRGDRQRGAELRGRADDFAWPRREVGREQAKGDTPVANVAPDSTAAAPAQRQHQSRTQPSQTQPGQTQPSQPGQPVQVQQPQQKQQPKPAQNAAPSLRDFFGFGINTPAPRQTAPPPGRSPTTNNGGPRPPANVGPSAAVPPAYPTR